MKTIAVVENNSIGRLAAVILQQHGFSPTVLGVAEAAGIIRARKQDIAALVTNSPWLFLEFSADLPLVYLSSTPMPDMEAAFRACRIVQKPFKPVDLVKAVRELIGDEVFAEGEKEKTALTEIALRVLNAHVGNRHPAPEDVKALRAVLPEPESKLNGDELALRVLEREFNRPRSHD